MMRIVLTLMCVLLGVPALAARGVVVKRHTAPQPKRGPDVIQTSVEVIFPEGGLTYRGMAHKGSNVALSGKWGDHFLGLSFGQAVRTNGGWDLWNFLTAKIRHGSKTITATSHYILDGVYVLENGQRSMVALRWPLDESKKAPGPQLTLTLLEDGSMPHWIFVQVQADAPADLSQVVLSCYPANTAGPKARQRWIATPDHQYNLNESKAAPPVAAGAVVYYNQLAQQRDGCFLVYDPSQFQSLEVAGTYSIRSAFTPRKDRRQVTFALGYFADESADKAARDFFRDTAGGVRQYLKSIDWRPNADPAQAQSLIRFVDQVVAQHGKASEKTQWQSLKSDYEQADKQQESIRKVATIQEMRTFKQALLKRVLSTYR